MLKTNKCPHVVTADEGTSYCNLAESSVRELKAKLQIAVEALKFYPSGYKLYAVSITKCGAIQLQENQNGFELFDGNKEAQEAIKKIGYY